MTQSVKKTRFGDWALFSLGAARGKGVGRREEKKKEGIILSVDLQ